MPNKLYNILVPINFTSKNKWAIAKAIEIANSFDCNIHFVNVVHSMVAPILPIEASNFTPYESHAQRMDNYERLKELAAFYNNQLCGNGTIEISVLEGNPEMRLAEYAATYEMDMVVIGLSKFNLVQRMMSSASIGRLSRKNKCSCPRRGTSRSYLSFQKDHTAFS